jgi:hypothetical protein
LRCSPVNVADVSQGSAMPAAANLMKLPAGTAAIRHALALERKRANRCRNVVAHARSASVRARYRIKLAVGVNRAAQLALALVDSGERVPLTQVRWDFDERLLRAMETAMHGGDLPAGRVRVARHADAILGA